MIAQVPVEIPVIVTAIVQLGLSVALCLFFVWRDHLRERSTSVQMREQEQFQRETMTKLIIESNEHIALGTETLKNVVQILERYELRED